MTLLLEDKADPNTKDKAGQTCLHYATRDGLVQIIRILISSEKMDIDVRDNVSTGKSAASSIMLVYYISWIIYYSGVNEI